MDEKEINALVNSIHEQIVEARALKQQNSKEATFSLDRLAHAQESLAEYFVKKGDIVTAVTHYFGSGNCYKEADETFSAALMYDKIVKIAEISSGVVPYAVLETAKKEHAEYQLKRKENHNLLKRSIKLSDEIENAIKEKNLEEVKKLSQSKALLQEKMGEYYVQEGRSFVPAAVYEWFIAGLFYQDGEQYQDAIRMYDRALAADVYHGGLSHWDRKQAKKWIVECKQKLSANK